MFKSVDIYIQSALLPKFSEITGWKCENIYNRGTRVGPDAKISCHMTDVYQCRFESTMIADRSKVLELLKTLHEQGHKWMDIHPII